MIIQFWRILYFFFAFTRNRTYLPVMRYTVRFNSLVMLVGTVFVISIFPVMLIDVKQQKEIYLPDYSVYHDNESLNETLFKLCQMLPNFVRFHKKEYFSRQGRKQYVLIVTNFRNKQYLNGNHEEIVKILFSFGEHAREFVPVESVLHLLKQLLYNQETDSRILANEIDLNKLVIYVILNANPDGRHYVETTGNYCWRGTSTGVDLNRNFDWEFGGKGSSEDPKDEEYKGAFVFSEPETMVYRDLTEEIMFDAFVSFHSGIRQIYIPYADTYSHKTGREPENLKEMQKLARILSTCTTKKYQYGKAININKYTADGTIFDYMAGVRKIPFSYAIELWGTDNHIGLSCFDLFNPPNELLQEMGSFIHIVLGTQLLENSAVTEIYPIYTTLFQHLIQWKSQHISHTVPHQNIGSLQQFPPDYIHSLQYALHSEQVDILTITSILFLLCLVVLTVLVSIHGQCTFCRHICRRQGHKPRAFGSTHSYSILKT